MHSSQKKLEKSSINGKDAAKQVSQKKVKNSDDQILQTEASTDQLLTLESQEVNLHDSVHFQPNKHLRKDSKYIEASILDTKLAEYHHSKNDSNVFFRFKKIRHRLI